MGSRLRKSPASLGTAECKEVVSAPNRSQIIDDRRIVLCIAASSDPSFVPVFRQNVPDAFVLPHRNQFIAYSTNDGPNVPMAISNDLVQWAFVGGPDGKKRTRCPSSAAGPRGVHLGS